MTWEVAIQLLTLILGSGGVVALFLISEKKTGAILENMKSMIENMNKANGEWQHIVEQKEKDIDSLKDINLSQSDKIDKLYAIQSKLQSRLDNINTECAVARILKCEVVSCSSRKPPLGAADPVISDVMNDDDYNSEGRSDYHRRFGSSEVNKDDTNTENK